MTAPQVYTYPFQGKIILKLKRRASFLLLNQKKAVIHINDRFAKINMSKYIKEFIVSYIDNTYKNIIFLCIGTDRSTGDSLGPLIGYKLSHLRYNNIAIMGTLDEPIHAKNLEEKVKEIKRIFDNPFIIAIDACLGHSESVGRINICNGPIYPGAGVNKNLLPVGNINITGIVNVSGYMEYFVLQNTRLNIVMKMADIIAGGILYSINDIHKIIFDINNLTTDKPHISLF